MAAALSSPTWTGGETEETLHQPAGPHRTQDTLSISFTHMTLHLKENQEKYKTIKSLPGIWGNLSWKGEGLLHKVLLQKCP